jgi:patatin-related protein
MASSAQTDDDQSAAPTPNQPATSTPVAKQSGPQADYKQEVRFAVVMYGGVSLAIYINGIAQELFRIVSSTAPVEAGGKTAVATNELSSTEAVYRKLSYILSNRAYREECQNLANANKKTLGFKLPEAPADDTIETRFVVDVLSGTSAGGINAIFLAKALANNQNIDQLKELWVNEGDIGLLINDKRSVSGLGLKNQIPPQSLLNSRRMYLKLLRALDDMERPKRSDDKTQSRFLDEAELDLFITTTDIQGLALPLRLSDSVVFERRHRNVFRLKYASETATDEHQNDFVAANNPFMAFAARCTSSFPFAFEPMKLSDIDEVLERFPQYRSDKAAQSGSGNWDRFFDSDMRGATACLTDRPFGDGGYLDNKPFSFAVDTISRRQASVPVDRKLIYIEPSPEHPENENLELNQVNALQNVKAAILDLPTYETIRQDLERVLERNGLINRVNQITEAIDKDLDDSRVRRPNLEPGEWETLDLAGMVQRFGIYYIPYRRLRIAAASDELARTVAKMLGLDEESANYLAVRSLVYAWRESHYKDENANRDQDQLIDFAHRLSKAATGNGTGTQNVDQVEGMLRQWIQVNFSDAYAKSKFAKPPESTDPRSATVVQRKTANQFLLDYDFKYWLRRLTFLRSKIDHLLQLDKIPFKNGKLDTTDKQQIVLDRLNKHISPSNYAELSPADKAEIRTVLNFLRCEVGELYKTLRREGRKLQSPAKTPEGSLPRQFAKDLSEITFSPKMVSYLLGTVDSSGNEQSFSRFRPEDAMQRAKDLFAENSLIAAEFNAEGLRDQFNKAAETLRQAVAAILKPAWNHCELLLKTEAGLEILRHQRQTETNVRCKVPESLGPHTKSIRTYLWHYLRKFDDYDQVRFPIMYGTDAGEADVVEVFRISPEDAPSLIDEREESKKPNGRQKLAGTTLHHFGAFLDRVWRQNDIMWGRLDGAERLITAMLPYPFDANVRDALIKEAHGIILREELSTESRAQLSMLMSEALIRASSGEPIEEAIQAVTKELTEASPVRTRLASAMTAIFDDDLVKNADDKLVTFVKLGYRVNRRLDPKAMLETISRSTQTIGGIFEDLANKNDLDGKTLSWIARLGQFFWGLVQVAVPNSILNKLVTHWIYLLYMFEVVVIVGGILLARPGAQQFGWLALGITAFLNVMKLLLTDLMRDRNVVKRLGTVIVVSLGLLFIVIGVLKVVGVVFYSPGELTPLSWLSLRAGAILQQIGPFRAYVVPLLGLVFLAVLLTLLNSAGMTDFGIFRRRLRTKVDDFKPIKLKRFKKRDMQNIQLCPTSKGDVYIIPARLSAEPPGAWVSAFLSAWAKAKPNTTVKVYRDNIRFSSDLPNVSAVWNSVKGVIDATNMEYSAQLKKQQDDFSKLQQGEDERRDLELKNKWDTLKELS